MKYLVLFENFLYNMAGYGHGEQRVSVDIAYHVTPLIHMEQVMREGLVPKSPSPNEPTAIYLTSSFDAAVTLCILLNRDRKLKCDYAMLQVDTQGLELYLDPYATREKGMYSTEPIEPTRLSIKTVVDYDIFRSQGNFKKFQNWWAWGKDKPDFVKQFNMTPDDMKHELQRRFGR